MLPLLAILWSCASPPPPAAPPPEEPATAEPTAEQLPEEPARHFTIEVRDAIPELSTERSADALSSAGHRYHEAGDLYAAALLWREALRVDGDHALAHYNYACAMALAREIQGHGCGPLDAPRSAIVGHLEAAAMLRADRRQRMLEDPDLADVRDLMVLQILAGADPSEPVTLSRLLVGTTFWDPPKGAYGSTQSLDLGEDGAWTITILPSYTAVHGAEPPPPGTGTWTLEGTTLTLGGRAYTVVPEQGTLLLDERVVWTELPSECDA